MTRTRVVVRGITELVGYSTGLWLLSAAAVTIRGAHLTSVVTALLLAGLAATAKRVGKCVCPDDVFDRQLAKERAAHRAQTVRARRG
jgi:hypothetical protein